MSGVARILSWAEQESAFVSELQEGSEAAFDWLVTHYHGPVFNLVCGMLGDPADAADVTQEVFLKAFRGIRSFRRSSSLKTWLYRIAIRQALNHRRWRWRHQRQETSINVEGDFGHGSRELEDGGATPFDLLAAREIQRVVRRGLRRVPAVFRSAVILRDLEGLSYEEVAEILDVSVGTVKSRILRGRRALREALEPFLEGETRGAIPTCQSTVRPAVASGGARSAQDSKRARYGSPVYSALARAVGSERGAMHARVPGGGAK